MLEGRSLKALDSEYRKNHSAFRKSIENAFMGAGSDVIHAACLLIEDEANHDDRFREVCEWMIGVITAQNSERKPEWEEA
jgi:hypothetical protein